MTTIEELLTNARAYLVDASIVRMPRVAGDAPPMWIDKDVPGPGEQAGLNPVEVGPDAVLGIHYGGGIPVKPNEKWHRLDLVDFWVRVTRSPVAYGIEAQLRDALADQRDFQMAALRVIESLSWRALQRVTSDAQGFTFTLAYLFETYSD